MEYTLKEAIQMVQADIDEMAERYAVMSKKLDEHVVECRVRQEQYMRLIAVVAVFVPFAVVLLQHFVK